MNLYMFLVNRGFHSIRMESGKIVSLEFINSKDYKFVSTCDDETFVFRGQLGKVEIFLSFYTEKNIYGDYYTSGNINISGTVIVCDFVGKSDYQKVKKLFPSFIKEVKKDKINYTKVRFLTK